MFTIIACVPLPTQVETLGAVLLAIVHSSLGTDWYVTFREPGDNADDPRVRTWHQEGESFTDAVFWSNTPTEFRCKDTKERLIAKPFEMIWVDNHQVEHRQPLITEPRWFFRAVSAKRRLCLL